MGRPRKNPLSPAAGPVEVPTTTGTPGSVAALLDKHSLPPRDINGEPNPAYYRAAYAAVFDLTFNAVRAGASIPWNADSVMKMIDREAEAAGFDATSIKDKRSEGEKIADAVTRLCDEPSAIWELEDNVALALEKQMDNADQKSLEYMRGRTQSPKVWRDRLARVRRLRERAKTPTSPRLARNLLTLKSRPIPYHPSDEELAPCAIEAAWPLRVMVYCGRTNIADRLKGAPADAVYDISHHHCKAACDDWEAVNGVAYRMVPGFSLRKVVRGVIDYKGVILVMPFGHGKTDLGRFLEACTFVKNPKTQLGLNHAASEKAQETLAYLASLFSRGTPIGRRFVSLFGLETEQANAKGFRLKMPDRLKSPSAWAAGVKSKVLGGNTSEQWWDDPVPMSDAEQETERKRTFQLLNGQWTSRQRAVKWFTRITATLWHNDDAISALIKLARDGKIKFRVSIQRCGGPKTNPPFQSLWPNVMPSSELKARYQQMRNPSLYSAAYMSDPRSDSSRIVKKLRLYDPLLEEHKRFLANSVKYLSLDPSATVGRKSDLAGVLYAGFGSVHVSRVEDDQPVHSAEQRIRVFTCDSISATQSDLVNYTTNLCLYQTVDYVAVESRSGFIGTCEMFENQFGITPIRLDPKNRDKGERLRAAAPAIENANADLGFHAVVEFPGVRTGKLLHDGTPELAIDPRVQLLAEEILDFGVCATNHEVDTLSQLVIYLSPELGIGTGGIVSKQAAQVERIASDPAILALLGKYEQKKSSGNAAQDEQKWLLENGWGGQQG